MCFPFFLKIMQRIASLYNPDQLTKEELIDRFVVRLKTYNKIFNNILESKMEHPEQHILIEGQRGMGKTTMLLRLFYEIENTPSLNTWLVPILFNEEQYSINRLFKLWEKIAEYLKDKHSNFTGLYDAMDELYDQLNDAEAYEKAAFDLLIKRLNEHRKKLVLFIDNFGTMFSKFNKQEAQRFREILMNCSNIRIIAASSIVAEHFFQNGEPLFESFKREWLRGLNREETTGLLLKLGESLPENIVAEIIKTQPARVETLHRITGGVIRTMILFFEVFLDNRNGHSFGDLAQIVDRMTPIYKHKMNDLSKQQQEIVDAIALHWDAITTKEIVKKTRLESKKISAQLKYLTDIGVVDKIKTNTKNHLYQVNERFFNIWYLIRNGSKQDTKRIIWIVRFFESWCNENMFKNRVRKHINYSKNENYRTHRALILTQTFSQSTYLNWTEQHELVRINRDFLTNKNTPLIGHLSKSDKELFDEGSDLFNKEKYKLALNIFLEINNPTGLVLHIIALLYKVIYKDYKKAEQYFLMAINNGHIDSMYNLAIFYGTKYKDYTKAEEYYLMAIDNGHIDAMNSLIWSYYKKIENKNEALELSKKTCELDKHKYYQHTYASVFLWDNQYQKSQELANEFLYDIELITEIEDDIIDYLLLLMAKGQYHYLYDYFTNEKGQALHIKDRFKPVYYALMHFMKDKYPNEYLKMGSELKETVEEIINKVEEMAVKYA
jgi:DNA-binding transcriptional regulator GbsR (MarR family)